MEKIRCFELDFGDQNLISKDKKDILSWIEADLDDLQNPMVAERDGDDDLQYTISIKLMTQKELDDLPDWG